MPLVTETTERQLPDENGGWYWFKRPGHDWAPEFVLPAKNGWGSTIEGPCGPVECKDAPGIWGPQIMPPNVEGNRPPERAARRGPRSAASGRSG